VAARNPETYQQAEIQVVLPCCNRRRYLQDALESVLAQTYRDFHVVIIDDASTDGTLELAKDYEQQEPHRLTVVSKPERRGLADSWMLGLALTDKARYVAFHNDDDVWLPTKLEAQIGRFREYPSLGFIATEAAVIDAEGRPTGERFSDLFGKPDAVNPAKRIFWNGNCYCAASVMASRPAVDLIERHYPFAGRCMDMYMWLVISSRLSVAWLDASLTRYRVAGGQMSDTHAHQMWRESYSLRRYLLTKDEAVCAAVGGRHAARGRLDDHALWVACLYLRKMDLRNYAWFAWQILKRANPRLAALLAKYTAKALLDARRPTGGQS
jgi:glycosyltransferase involved in cell wall biosynthesis